MKKRIEVLEKIKRFSKYAAVVVVVEGQPLPDNIGPGTVVIIDDVQSRATYNKKRAGGRAGK